MALRLARLFEFAVAGWLGMIGLLGPSASVQAAAPQAVFDSPAVVAVRDATTLEFATLNPGEKLIEVVWHVSVLVARGAESDIDEVVVTLQSPERRGRIVDFWPRTELTHDIVGPIQTTTGAEHNASLKLNVVGGWPVPAGPLTGNFDANKSQRNTTNEQYQRLPPRTAVLASGTTAQGHGVFFKLRRWSQASLEGAHEFRTLMAVPQAWRGDWMLVTAEAHGIDQNLFGSATVDAGQSQFAVGLYLEADRDARLVVEKLVRLRQHTMQHGAVQTLPKLSELLSGKSQASLAKQDRDRAVIDSLRAVRQLSGTTNVR